jgi:hypothetical protein
MSMATANVQEQTSNIATLADYVRAVSSAIPSDLIDAWGLEAIERIACLFPAAVSNHLIFECRLGVPEAGSDLSIGASVAEGGRRILAGRHVGIPQPDCFSRNPGWSRVRDFCSEWDDPDSPLNPGANHLWMEFDIAVPDGSEPVPNLFFAPRHGNLLGNGAQADNPLAQLARSTFDRGIELFSGKPLPTPTADALRHCFAVLPPHAWAFQVGVMGAREPAPVRMQFSHLTTDEFLTFLTNVGWTGTTDGLGVVLNDLSKVTDDITYGMDFDGGVGPKIGLECYLHDDGDPRATSKWVPFLDYLVSQGLCLQSKAEALLEYPGRVQETDCPENWPDNLSQASRMLGGTRVPVLSKYVHHIKVVFLHGRAVEAKAYPGLSLLWATR